MNARVVARYTSDLPADDDHPYRTGAWRPNHVEYDAVDLDVTGELPPDLRGVYLRNTENPLLDSLGRYHPFDGDGMLHSISFGEGVVGYRNRFVRTVGWDAERTAGRALWAGLMEAPSRSERDGWGARTRLKDASSTDVVVHAGRALTTHYQCGDGYRLHPSTLEPAPPDAWMAAFPWGISAHTKLDEATGELLVFSYSKQPPYLRYGIVDADNASVHTIDVELPGPRLPHDMAFTPNYAILNDCPMFWDPDLLARDVHAVRFFPDLPTRFAVVPRRGSSDEVRWFEASPTYVLHWINAFEEGDEVVLDGFHQSHPVPDPRPDDDGWQQQFRFLDATRLETRAHRWRFNLRTGQVKEEFLSDAVVEFGTINGGHGGRPYRYTYAATNEPGWFLFNGIVRLDVTTGDVQRYRCPPGVYVSESPMAPALGSAGEDDGYVVTFSTDVTNDRSECLVFDARDIASGPIARVALPERISSGTHACWAGATQLTG